MSFAEIMKEWMRLKNPTIKQKYIFRVRILELNSTLGDQLFNKQLTDFICEGK